jgi:hypothetical protein
MLNNEKTTATSFIGVLLPANADLVDSPVFKTRFRAAPPGHLLSLCVKARHATRPARRGG